MSTGSCDIEESAERNELRPNAQELWRHYQKESGGQSENALVERYLPLVRYAVGRLAMTLPDHVDRDDLHSARRLKAMRGCGFAARCWTNCAAWTGCRAPSMKNRGKSSR